MNRRKFISTTLFNGLALACFGLPSSALQAADTRKPSVIDSDVQAKNSNALIDTDTTRMDQAIRDAIDKARDFEHNYKTDFYLTARQAAVLTTALLRLTRLQRLVGYANFSLLDFDKALKYAKNYSIVGPFSKSEIILVESLFAFDASHYGFFGKKVFTRITDKINVRDVKKISGTGHYIYRGDAINLYSRLRAKLGEDLILTSGIRGVVKQLHLFMAKAVKSDGNLSRAARSLAPPGHSFHGIGDFDVGQRGLGAANFTSAFTHTEIHKNLSEMGLIVERYPQSNPYGVRYEPWHIKVVKDV